MHSKNDDQSSKIEMLSKILYLFLMVFKKRLKNS